MSWETMKGGARQRGGSWASPGNLQYEESYRVGFDLIDRFDKAYVRSPTPINQRQEYKLDMRLLHGSRNFDWLCRKYINYNGLGGMRPGFPAAYA